MPATPHIEKHFTATATVRDIVVGMSDGLTVPFALAAGLSGAVGSAAIVVTAGLAEIAAGSIAMGLGGYLAAQTDREHYEAERTREVVETKCVPEMEEEEVAAILRDYGLADEQVMPVVKAISADRNRWVDFMMRFELGLDEPDAKRLLQSPLTIGSAYIIGGLIPLLPYIMWSEIETALFVSVGLTLLALLLFGGAKGYFTGVGIVRAAMQTMLIGAAAAAAAFGVAKLIS